MLKTIRAKINRKGEVKLLEPIKIENEKNAIITILDDDFSQDNLVSINEKSLSKDWDSEEDSRWDKILK